MEFFCHTILGDGLVKRREVTLGLCRGAVAEGLYDALAVDVVVYGEPVAALADGVHLVERGVGDILVGKVVDERCVGTQACHRVWIGGMLVVVNTHPFLLGDVPVCPIVEGIVKVWECAIHSGNAGRGQAVEPVVPEVLPDVERRVVVFEKINNIYFYKDSCHSFCF